MNLIKTPNTTTQAAMQEARQMVKLLDTAEKSDKVATPVLQLTPASLENEDYIFETFKLALKEYVEWAWGWDDAQQSKALFALAPIQEFQMICCSHRPVGILLLEKRAQDHYLRTIFLHPDQQRKGIGRLVISALQKEAQAARKPLLLRVIRINPAQRLYERLGFTVVKEEEKTLLMQWHDVHVSNSV